MSSLGTPEVGKACNDFMQFHMCTESPTTGERKSVEVEVSATGATGVLKR